VIVTANAVAKAGHGDNRKAVVDILSGNGRAMTNAEIAKVAHQRGTIKSKKGYSGVYATVASVLSRGKNVFVNANGRWDLKDRKPIKQYTIRTISPTESPVPQGAPIPPEIARLGLAIDEEKALYQSRF
jgi:hypothetical protein